MASLAFIEVIGGGVMKSSARTRLCGFRFGLLEYVSWACWQPAYANEPRPIDASAHRAALPLISYTWPGLTLHRVPLHRKRNSSTDDG